MSQPITAITPYTPLLPGRSSQVGVSAQEQPIAAAVTQRADEADTLETSTYYKPLTLKSIETLAKTPASAVHFKVPSEVVLSPQEKQHIIKQLVNANKLALGHKAIHRLRSGIHNGNIVEMDNGKTGWGVNAEGHVELSVCSERAAIVNAITLASRDQIETILQGTPLPKRLHIPKVKRSFQAGERLQPCGECLPWMQSQIFYTPDSECYIVKQRSDNQWEVECRRVKDMIPIHLNMSAPYSHRSISKLPIQLSDEAKTLTQTTTISEATLRQMVGTAKKCFLTMASNPVLTPRTLRNMAATVLLSDGTMETAPYVEIRRFSHALPDFTAFNQALQKSQYFQNYTNNQHEKPPHVVAIAYYGTNSDFPTTAQLNAFAHKNWAGPQTLVITPSDNAIKVRTIRDYLPYNFNADKFVPSTNGRQNAFS